MYYIPSVLSIGAGLIDNHFLKIFGVFVFVLKYDRVKHLAPPTPATT